MIHPETIAAAAIRDSAGKLTTARRPFRHCDIVLELAKAGDEAALYGDKGFVTSAGRFVERGEAMTIAVAAGQVKQGAKQELNTEDLW